MTTNQSKFDNLDRLLFVFSTNSLKSATVMRKDAMLILLFCVESGVESGIVGFTSENLEGILTCCSWRRNGVGKGK